MSTTVVNFSSKSVSSVGVAFGANIGFSLKPMMSSQYVKSNTRIDIVRLTFLKNISDEGMRNQPPFCSID